MESKQPRLSPVNSIMSPQNDQNVRLVPLQFYRPNQEQQSQLEKLLQEGYNETEEIGDERGDGALAQMSTLNEMNGTYEKGKKSPLIPNKAIIDFKLPTEMDDTNYIKVRNITASGQTPKLVLPPTQKQLAKQSSNETLLDVPYYPGNENQ